MLDNKFEIDFDRLLLSVTTYPEDEQWFYPALKTLIEEHGQKVVAAYANKKGISVYNLAILIKAGFKEIEEALLLQFLKLNDEDEVYDAALSLAIYGHPKGFETLYEFANESHKLSKHIIPKIDILPDLKFINNSQARALEAFIKNKYPDIEIK